MIAHCVVSYFVVTVVIPQVQKNKLCD